MRLPLINSTALAGSRKPGRRSKRTACDNVTTRPWCHVFRTTWVCLWEQTMNVFILSHFLLFSYCKSTRAILLWAKQKQLTSSSIIFQSQQTKKPSYRAVQLLRLCCKWQNENNCGALQLRKDINMDGQRCETEWGRNGPRSARLWSASLITLIVKHDSTINLIPSLLCSLVCLSFKWPTSSGRLNSQFHLLAVTSE